MYWTLIQKQKWLSSQVDFLPARLEERLLKQKHHVHSNIKMNVCVCVCVKSDISVFLSFSTCDLFCIKCSYFISNFFTMWLLLKALSKYFYVFFVLFFCELLEENCNFTIFNYLCVVKSEMTYCLFKCHLHYYRCSGWRMGHLKAMQRE